MSAKRRQLNARIQAGSGATSKEGQLGFRVAAQLGIRPDMLRHWKQQVGGSELARTEVFPGHGKVVSSEQDLRRLRRELERVTQERVTTLIAIYGL